MSRILSKWFLAGFLAVRLLISPAHLWSEESLTLSIGIVPQQNATKLARLWTPICNYLSQQTGHRFVFKTAKDIPTFEKRLAAGEYDIAYMNPYQISIRGSDELAQTAGTFNQMSLNLEQSYQQLNDALAQAHETGRELALSEAKMRAVVDGAVDGIITIDENGIIESFNPAAETMFGYTSREVIGKNIRLLVPEPHKKKHSDYIRRYITTGNAKIIGIGREVDGERKNGDLFPLELGISEIKIDQKRLFTGIVRDISERKKTDEELRRHRENLEQLVEERTRELEDTQQKLVEQAFESGRAQLGAMMLHNIGNRYCARSDSAAIRTEDDGKRIDGVRSAVQ